MNQRLLIGLIVLAGIGSIGSVLAYSGTISAGQGNFNNVLVTGTCSGCAGDGTFTTYTLLLNETVAGTSGGFSTTGKVSIGTDGTTIASDSTPDVAIVLLNGTVTGVTTLTTTEPQILTAGTNGGQYNIYNDGTNVKVYSGKNLIQTIAIDTTHSFFNSSKCSIEISPDGKYIVIYGNDQGNLLQHIQVWRGS